MASINIHPGNTQQQLVKIYDAKSLWRHASNNISIRMRKSCNYLRRARAIKRSKTIIICSNSFSRKHYRNREKPNCEKIALLEVITMHRGLFLLAKHDLPLSHTDNTTTITKSVYISNNTGVKLLLWQRWNFGNTGIFRPNEDEVPAMTDILHQANGKGTTH